MTIASEITNYVNGLSDAYNAVNDMQGIIPTDKNMNNLDTAIRTIPQSQGATYTAGNGINIDANNEISIDDTVVAELSDIPTVVQTLGSSTADVISQKAVTDTIYDEYGQGIVIDAGPGWDDTMGSIALGKNVNLSDNYGEIGIGNFSEATTPGGVSLGYRAANVHYGGASIGAYSADDFTQVSLDDYGYVSVGRNSALTFTSEVTGESTTIPAFTRRIVGVKDPLNNQDAATKNYVDTVTSGKQDTLTAGTNVSISNNVISATDTTYSNFTGATSSVAGTNGLVPAPAAGDEGKALHGDGTWKDTTAKLVEMSYGEANSWAKFIAAYNAGSIVYCRASSNANPGTGSQTRKAFMAYVNNAANPTSVEFQYVRSQSSKSDSQQTDQVFVYTLTNASGGTWSVASRNMSPKINVSGPITKTFTSGANAIITIGADTMTGATSSAAGAAGVVPAPAAGDENKVLKGNGAWTDLGGNYSTSEQATPFTWVDGSTIYKKTIVITTNFGFDTVTHGISNLDNFVKIESMLSNVDDLDPSSAEWMPIPHYDDAEGFVARVFADRTNVTVSKSGLWLLQPGAKTYTTLYYTKSS